MSNNAYSLREIDSMTNQEKARKLIPIVQAMAEGKTIQYRKINLPKDIWAELLTCQFDLDNYYYRIKIETINVNGIEVPKPESKALEYGKLYWFVNLTDKDLVNRKRWTDNDNDHLYLKRQLIHLTQEAALLHANAILSILE